jgi:hypothetical protein
MKVNLSKVALLSAVLATVAASGNPAWAGKWADQHPRRAEVNGRDANLNRRINNHEGNLDGHYGQLKHEDHAIRHQERMDARVNGGHITSGEKAQLNHEENRVNRQIERDKHR